MATVTKSHNCISFLFVPAWPVPACRRRNPPRPPPCTSLPMPSVSTLQPVTVASPLPTCALLIQTPFVLAMAGWRLREKAKLSPTPHSIWLCAFYPTLLAALPIPYPAARGVATAGRALHATPPVVLLSTDAKLVTGSSDAGRTWRSRFPCRCSICEAGRTWRRRSPSRCSCRDWLDHGLYLEVVDPAGASALTCSSSARNFCTWSLRL